MIDPAPCAARLIAALLAASLTVSSTAAPRKHPGANATHEAEGPEKEGVAKTGKGSKGEPARPIFTPAATRSSGSVNGIVYDAVAGTLVVHPKDYDDIKALEERAIGGASEDSKSDKDPPPEASIFYAAYFKSGVAAGARPITFVFNGGPGSSSIWLHMGAFGPMRVLTADHSHGPAAPYQLVANDMTLLDASDLVFIDAPGTGFSRIGGKDKDKAFYGVDQDIHAFAEFITQFLTEYGRWNSPKYLFGESYGTMRGAGLALALQERDVDLNGVMLLSNILNWDVMPDDPQVNPSIDAPYIVALPTYAATAWYHDRVRHSPAGLPAFLTEVENFATTDYAAALIKGNDLPPAERQRIAARLSAYTGLSPAYLLKTNLRIEYGAFQKELLGDRAQTVGTLDTRFVGDTIDPLSKVASYDPQSSAISAAYVAAFNSYARDRLHYAPGIAFKPGIPIYSKWDYRHQPPGADKPLIALPNVLPDLAVAMKRNPTLKVMVNGGYYDVSTPYFEGKFELRHLPVPPAIAANIEYHYYESGHMVYAHLPALHALHDNVADFIRRTDNLP